MPFAKEHAARQADPSTFKSFRRGLISGAPDGVTAIFGTKNDGTRELQSVRFAKDKFTVERAKSWLRKRGFKLGAFEEATAKVRWTQTIKIAERDDAEHLVFGWLYTASDPHHLVADPAHIAPDGTVVDHSGQTIAIADLEKASYEYVEHSRVATEMHARADGSPVSGGHLVECVVYTPEKRKAMGMADDAVPDAMWCGWRITNMETWAKILSGELSELSLAGHAIEEML